MSSVCPKAKTFTEASPPEHPKGLCHGPTEGLTALPPQTPNYFSHYARVSCSYNLGIFGPTDVDFFSVLTLFGDYIFADVPTIHFKNGKCLKD